MLMNILLATSFYPVFLIIYILLRRYSNEQNGMYFGLHLPQNAQMQAIIEATQKAYRRQLDLIFLLSIVLPLPAFFTRHVSIQFSIWMIWFLTALVVYVLPYICANERLLKEKNRQLTAKSIPGADHPIPSDTVPESSYHYAELRQVRRVKSIAFVPPILIGFAASLPLLRMGEGYYAYSYVTLILAITTIVFYLTAKWMDSLSDKVINEDSQINAAYAGARKNVWKNCWLGETWLNTLVILLLAASLYLQKASFGLLIWTVIAESFLAIAILLAAMKQIQRIDRTYQPRTEAKFSEDDDTFWKWGIFYNNPNDKRTLVDKRFGIGMTTNMASTGGKLSSWIAVLALIWIPFLCIWMIFQDFTPIQVCLENDTIICQHLKEEYIIPLNQIKECELVTELPPYRTKSNGTATDTLEKGRYYCSEHGSYYEFLNPENSIFIFIETDDKIYYLSGVDDAQTHLIWEKLQ